MVEKLIQALKNKYSNLGLGNDQLSGVAALLALSVNSDEGIDAAVTAAEPLMKSMQSENDKQRTAAAKAAQELKELQEKVKQFEDKQNPPKPEPKPEETVTLPQLMKMMESFSADLKAIKGEKITNDRKAQISTLTDGLPDSMKAVYNRMDYSAYDEAQFAELKETVKAETEKIKAEISQRGFNPPFAHNQLDGNPKKATKEEIKAVMDLMPKR